jgi:hypothetical protein
MDETQKNNNTEWDASLQNRLELLNIKVFEDCVLLK